MLCYYFSSSVLFCFVQRFFFSDALFYPPLDTLFCFVQVLYFVLFKRYVLFCPDVGVLFCLGALFFFFR